MTDLLQEVDTPSDAELISRVRGGDVAAYGELFARHIDAANRLGRQLARGPDIDDLVSEAFAKVLRVLQGGGGPDVAFRAYLLTSVRRLHVDRIRAGAKLQTSDDMTQFDPGIPFQDTAVAKFENSAAAKAFASLPERWQLVLWHLEVEGQKPAEIAPLLGMSANSVSALAYRAREGLRQAFLTQHLKDISETQCRWANEHLGAYVRRGLSRRDTTKVEEHLEECRRCMAMYLELTEVNSNLSAIIGPLLLGAAATGYLASTGTAAGAGIFGLVSNATGWVTGNASAMTAGAVAAGVTAVATAGFLFSVDNDPTGRVVGADDRIESSIAPGETGRSTPRPTSPAISPTKKAARSSPTSTRSSPSTSDTSNATTAPLAPVGATALVTLPADVPAAGTIDEPLAETPPGEGPAPDPDPDPGPDPGPNPDPNPDPGPLTADLSVDQTGVTVGLRDGMYQLTIPVSGLPDTPARPSLRIVLGADSATTFLAAGDTTASCVVEPGRRSAVCTPTSAPAQVVIPLDLADLPGETRDQLRGTVTVAGFAEEDVRDNDFSQPFTPDEDLRLQVRTAAIPDDDDVRGVSQRSDKDGGAFRRGSARALGIPADLTEVRFVLQGNRNARFTDAEGDGGVRCKVEDDGGDKDSLVRCFPQRGATFGGMGALEVDFVIQDPGKKSADVTIMLSAPPGSDPYLRNNSATIELRSPQPDRRDKPGRPRKPDKGDGKEQVA